MKTGYHVWTNWLEIFCQTWKQLCCYVWSYLEIYLPGSYLEIHCHLMRIGNILYCCLVYPLPCDFCFWDFRIGGCYFLSGCYINLSLVLCFIIGCYQRSTVWQHFVKVCEYFSILQIYKNEILWVMVILRDILWWSSAPTRSPYSICTSPYTLLVMVNRSFPGFYCLFKYVIGSNITYSVTSGPSFQYLCYLTCQIMYYHYRKFVENNVILWLGAENIFVTCCRTFYD